MCTMSHAAVVESADTRDLKSLGSNTVPVQVRSAAPIYRGVEQSGQRHQYIAEWSSPVARRAHNPKVVGSNPASATIRKSLESQVLRTFLLLKTT